MRQKGEERERVGGGGGQWCQNWVIVSWLQSTWHIDLLILFNGQKQWREVNPGKGTACSQSGASQPAQPLHPQPRELEERMEQGTGGKKTAIVQWLICKKGWRGGEKKDKREEFRAGSSRKQCLWMSALNGEWMWSDSRAREGAQHVFNAH